MKPTELEILRSEVGTLRDLLAVHEEQARSQFQIIRAQRERLEERARSLDEVNRRLVATSAYLQELNRAIPSVLLVCDEDYRVLSANETTSAILEYSEAELIGRSLSELIVGPFDEVLAPLSRGGVMRAEMALRTKSDEPIALLVSATMSVGARTPDRPDRWLVLVGIDIRDRKRLEDELRQAQKLESIGRLAAGVAHEINTPVQYVGDSLQFLREAIGDLLLVRGDEVPEDSDVGYVARAVPEALDRASEGLQRIATIVRSMKEFTRPDSNTPALIDLNHAVVSTLMVARSEYKYVADVETELGTLPPFPCFAGDLGQALLNIVVNAAHAIADQVGDTGRRGTIRVVTRCEADAVLVHIGDTGGGIPTSIRDKIFDPFFTTKAVGRGTGQGLPLARRVIVERHGGDLTFETKLGVGTTFTIRLPRRGPAVASP